MQGLEAKPRRAYYALGKSPQRLYASAMTQMPEPGFEPGSGEARLLNALLDRRAFTALELARRTGLRPEAVNNAIRGLEGRFKFRRYRHGPHRYLALRGDGEIDRAAALLAGHDLPPPRPLRPSIAPDLRPGRTCFGHLAGVLGLALADGLLGQGYLSDDGENFRVTQNGQSFFENRMALDLAALERRGGRFAHPCLDRTERRPHLGGRLGRALAERCFELGWLIRWPGRGVRASPLGQQAFAAEFGAKLAPAVLN